MNDLQPTSNGDQKDAKGRFLPGHKYSKGGGDPYAKHVHRWRHRLYHAVTGERMAKVLEQLISRAEAGEPWAIHELLDRCIGKPKDDSSNQQITAIHVHVSYANHEPGPTED